MPLDPTQPVLDVRFLNASTKQLKNKGTSEENKSSAFTTSDNFAEGLSTSHKGQGPNIKMIKDIFFLSTTRFHMTRN